MIKLFRTPRKPQKQHAPVRAHTLAARSIYLQGPGKLLRSNGQLRLIQKDQPQMVVNIAHARELCIIGSVSLTPAARNLLLQQSIPVHFLSRDAQKALGELHAHDTIKPMRRVGQILAVLDNRHRLQLSQKLLQDKMSSQIAACLHYQHNMYKPAKQTRDAIQPEQSKINDVDHLASLRGLEGICTRHWFGLISQLLREPYVFRTRTRRPPRDPVNALLSLGYTLLNRKVHAAILKTGLDPALGFYHAYRPGRPSLTCDLMEPMRVPAVDRWVIQMCNQRQCRIDDFDYDAQKGCRLKPGKIGDIVARFESHWFDRMQEVLLEKLVARYARRLKPNVGWSTLKRCMNPPDQDTRDHPQIILHTGGSGP